MSAYEELLERCARTARPFAGDYAEAIAQDILADALRTLEAEAAWTGNGTLGAIQFRADLAYWLARSSLSVQS